MEHIFKLLLKQKKYLFLISVTAFGEKTTNIVAHLPPNIIKSISQLVVHRQGETPLSFMDTTSILQTVYPKQSYTFTKTCLKTVLDKPTTPSNISAITTPPSYLEVEAIWQNEQHEAPDGANILGGFGKFLVADTDKLDIPTNIATKETLAYYGAYFLESGDIFSFESDAPLPLTTMNIGEEYAEHYLNKPELGGGFYLEYHDRPHFHMPLNKDSRGYLVLGKRLQKNRYHLSAFQIPYETAILTPGGVIHDDGLLVGSYAVVYSVTDSFSTVIVENIHNQKVFVSASNSNS